MFKRICHTPDGDLFKDRRRGKDRRKTIDPRYRNPAYPEFVDRRRGDRRRPAEEGMDCVVTEHPDSQLVTTIGVLAGLFLLSLFFLTTIDVDQMAEVERAASIFCDNIIPYILPWSF